MIDIFEHFRIVRKNGGTLFHQESNTLSVDCHGINGPYSLQVADISGKNIFVVNGKAESQLERQFELPRLQPGIYIVNLRTKNQNLVQRFVEMQ